MQARFGIRQLGFLAGALLFIAVCSSEGQQTSQVGGDQPTTDHSLSAEEYVQLGMPAHDRIWSSEDMKRAIEVLTRLKNTNPEQLPRYKSERSGDVFARITADENLDLYRNLTLPLNERLLATNDYMMATNVIIKIYLEDYFRTGSGGTEFAELTGSALRIVVVLFDLVNEFIPTLDKNDETYAVRMDGLKKMKMGLSMVIAGTIDTISQPEFLIISERKRLVRYLSETIGSTLPNLSKSSQTEIIVRLKNLNEDPSMQDLQPELGELMESLKLIDGA